MSEASEPDVGEGAGESPSPEPPGPLHALDRALAVLGDSALDKVPAHVRFEPVDIARYRETFVQMGFHLPPSLDAFVSSRGLLRVPDLGSPFELASGSSGFHMADPDELFEAFLHLDGVIAEGVEVARSWLLVVLVHPRRYDGAFALMERELGTGEAPVGYYTDDGARRAPSEPTLPSRFESFDALIEAYANALSALPVRGDRAGIARALRTLSSAGTSQNDWQRVWAQHERGKLDWSVDVAARFKPVLAHADDPAIVEKLLRRIHGELEGQGRTPTDPALARSFERGAWPRELPGPDELLVRLPAEGASGLRGVARFCLEWTGFSPSDEALVAGRKLLEEMCEGEVEEDRRSAAIAACAAIASPARGRVIKPGEVEAFYARALTWSLGHLTPARVRHVASVAMLLSTLAGTDEGRAAGLSVPATVQPFGWPAVFQKLSSIVRGQPDERPSFLREPLHRPAALPVHDALAAWLEAQEGSQKETLAALEASEWSERLRAAEPEDREWCLRLLRKKLNSKKVKDRREAWVQAATA
jgi:hypothetical protein